LNLNSGSKRALRSSKIQNLIADEKNVKISKETFKKINKILTGINPTYKGRNNKDYGFMTPSEIFEKITTHKYNENNPKHKKRYQKIKKILDTFSEKYNSCHSNNLKLYNKITTQEEDIYQYVGENNRGYTKLRSGLPSLYIIKNYSDEKQRLFDWNFSEVALCAYIVKTLKNHTRVHLYNCRKIGAIPFTFAQIEGIFGINKYHFEKYLKYLGIEIKLLQTEGTKYEKRTYKKYKYLDNKFNRGCYFSDYDTKIAEKFIKEYELEIDYDYMFRLRCALYTNKQELNSNWFEYVPEFVTNQFEKESSKKYHKYEWSSENFDKIIKGQVKQNALLYKQEYNRTSFKKLQDMDNKYIQSIKSSDNGRILNAERIKSQNMDAEELLKDFGLLKPFNDASDKKRKDLSHKLVVEDIFSSENIKRLNKLSFQQFCFQMNDIFKKLSNKYETIEVWRGIKDILIKKIENKIIVKKLTEIVFPEDILRSPIFTDKFAEYENLSSSTLKTYLKAMEKTLDKSVYMSDIEFTKRKRKIMQDVEKGELNTKLAPDEKLSPDQKESIIYDVKEYIEKKKIEGIQFKSRKEYEEKHAGDMKVAEFLSDFYYLDIEQMRPRFSKYVSCFNRMNFYQQLQHLNLELLEHEPVIHFWDCFFNRMKFFKQYFNNASFRNNIKLLKEWKKDKLTQTEISKRRIERDKKIREKLQDKMKELGLNPNPTENIGAIGELLNALEMQINLGMKNLEDLTVDDFNWRTSKS